MTYAPGQSVEVRFPSESDLQARAWGWWAGVVQEAGQMQGMELYHVRLDAGQVVTVGPGHLRAVAGLGGLFGDGLIETEG